MGRILIIAASFFAGWKYHEYTMEAFENDGQSATLVKSERVDQSQEELDEIETQIERARETGYLKGFSKANDDKSNVLKMYQKHFGELTPGAAMAMLKVRSEV